MNKKIIYIIFIFIGLFFLGFWAVKLYSNNSQLLQNNIFIINQLKMAIYNKDLLIIERELEIGNLLSKIHDKDQTIFDYMRSTNSKLSSKQISEITNTIFQKCDEYKVDSKQIFAICDVESDYKTDAIGKYKERGLTQVTPRLFNDYKRKLHLTNNDFYNWRYTLEISIIHYKYLIIKNQGNLVNTWAEYNAGSQRKYGLKYAQKVNIAYERIKRLEE